MYEEQSQNVRNSFAVYKTDRKLVELRDKLNPSFWGNYAAGEPPVPCSRYQIH